jgi:hypothetical protein
MNAEEFKAAVEAVDLTAVDAKAQILALNEGLMNSNTTLLTESKAKVATANEATELARAQAVKAEEDRLKLAGDVDGLKAHYEEQLASKVAEANQSAEQARNALTDRDKGEVINSILSNVDDRYKAFVKTQLDSTVSISYDETGKAVTSIKDGDAQYTSPTDFLSGVKESDTWKHVLKATSLSGAGTKQSNELGTQSKKYSEMNLEERSKFNSQ